MSLTDIAKYKNAEFPADDPDGRDPLRRADHRQLSDAGAGGADLQRLRDRHGPAGIEHHEEPDRGDVPRDDRHDDSCCAVFRADQSCFIVAGRRPLVRRGLSCHPHDQHQPRGVQQGAGLR